MDAEHLKDLVKRLDENRDFITNEETAKMALVVPFIRLLGYDPIRTLSNQRYSESSATIS